MTLVLGTAWLILAVLCINNPRLLLGLIGLRLILLWEMPVGPTYAVGSINLYLDDLLVALMLGTFFISRPGGRAKSRPPVPLLLAGLVVLLAVLRGVDAFGQSALQEARGFVYVLVATFWVLRQEWDEPAWKRAAWRFASWTSAGLILVSIVHVVVYGLGSVNSFVINPVDGTLQTGRPLVATQALFLGLVFILQYVRWTHGIGRLAPLLIIGSTVLLAQHRSVWLAELIGLLMAVILTKQGGARARALGVVLALVAMSGLAIAASPTLQALLVDATQQQGTFEARQGGWVALLQQSSGWPLFDRIWGKPFGTGFLRYQHGMLLEYSPHNWYVSVYLRLGIPGLVVLLLGLLSLLRGFSVRHGIFGIAAVSMLAVFLMAYSLPWQSVLAFAFIGSAEASHRVEAAPARRASRTTLELLDHRVGDRTPTRP